MADRKGATGEKSYRSRNRALSALVRSSNNKNVVVTDIAFDSANSTALIDSDYILAKKFIAGDGERRWNITTAAPTGAQQVSTGDFWLDRDDLIVYRLTADGNWTTTLPAGTFSAEAGLTSNNVFQANPGADTTTFNIGASHTPQGANGSFSSTFRIGSSPYNSGGRWTFTNPVNFSYYYMGNSDAGHLWSIGYTDGSYMVANSGLAGSKTVTPNSYTWYDAQGNSLGKTINQGNSGGHTHDVRHPNGVLATYIIHGRNNYGTRSYDAWTFFSGANSWQRVGEIYDSSDIKSVISSTYVSGLADSSVAINLKNSVELSLGKNVTQNVYTSAGVTVTGSRHADGSTNGTNTAHPYLQVSNLTDFLTNMDSGEAIWVSSDGVNFTNPSSVTWTGAHIVNANGHQNLIQLSTNVNFWTYSGQTIYNGSDVTRRTLRLRGDSDTSKIIASKNLSIEGDNGATITIAGYNIKDSAAVTSIIDSAYVQARQTASGGGVDSASTIALINSTIADSSVTSAFTYTYTATANQTTFTGNDNNNANLRYNTGAIQAFQNGVLLVDSADYVASTGTSLVLNTGATVGDIINITKFTRAANTGTLSHTQFKYLTVTPQSTISGVDNNNKTLTYNAGEIQVYLNGILLIDSDDYVATNGTSIVLTSATDSGDMVSISKFVPGSGGMAFRSENFVYTTGSPTTNITGQDDNSLTLSYIQDQIQVFRNGIMLIDSADYTATNGTHIVLNQATNAADTVAITAFRGVLTGGLDSANITNLIDSSYIQSRQSSGGGGGGGVTNADSIGVFAASPAAGSLHYAINTKALYLYDGSEYDRIFSGPNETITFDSALASTTVLEGSLRVSLGNTDSSRTILNFSASDDFEGFPITYSIVTVPSNPVQLDSAFGANTGIIDSSTHPTRPRITLLPSQRDSDEGSFLLRIRATDGTHVVSTTTTCSLAFSVDIVFSDATATNSNKRTITGLSAGGQSINGWTHDHNTLSSGGDAVISDALAIGKKYLELEVLAGSQIGAMIGITTDQTNQGYSTAAKQHSRYFNNGNGYGVSYGGALGGLTTVGTRIMVAYDTTSRKIWFGKDGTWLGDPAAGTGGATLNGNAGAPFYFSTSNGSTNSGQQNITVRKSPDDLTYTIPTGFGTH